LAPQLTLHEVVPKNRFFETGLVRVEVERVVNEHVHCVSRQYGHINSLGCIRAFDAFQVMAATLAASRPADVNGDPKRSVSGACSSQASATPPDPLAIPPALSTSTQHPEHAEGSTRHRTLPQQKSVHSRGAIRVATSAMNAVRFHAGKPASNLSNLSPSNISITATVERLSGRDADSRIARILGARYNSRQCRLG